VTAWTALTFDKAEKPETAFMQGTGGVSLFALLLCIGAGVKAIITSSSDDKLRKVAQLGTKDDDVLGINYRNTPDLGREVWKLS